MKYREVYGKYRRQPPKKQEAFYEAYRMELTHYEAAGRYLDGVMNGRTGIPLKAWKAEQIRKGVYAILREENRKEQLTHKHNLDR